MPPIQAVLIECKKDYHKSSPTIPFHNNFPISVFQKVAYYNTKNIRATKNCPPFWNTKTHLVKTKTQ